MTTAAPELDVDQALDLADDLLRQLAEHIGQTDKLSQVFTRWLDVLGHEGFSRVCMAALRTTFTDCLTMTPLDDIPPGSHVYVTNPKEDA